MTDNLYELRKFVLKDLIKEGYKYIARDKEGAIYAYSRKPTRQGKEWLFVKPYENNSHKNISLVSFILTDIKWEDEEPFRIPYTNWKEVPVDTPVVYTSGIGNGKTCVLHFCRYDKEKDRVILFTDGRTSFTEQGVMETYPERVTIYEKKEVYPAGVPICEQGEKLKNGNISNNNND